MLDAALLAACVLWAVLCFLPSLTFGFVSWDDPLHVTENPLVTAPDTQSLKDFWLTPALGYPSPVTVASYRIEASWFGLDSARPFHRTNVLLHGILVGLVFSLARALGLGRAAAALAALIVGLHPVVAEPVSWVSGRKDLLAAVFGLTALRVALGRNLDWRKSHSWFVLGLFTVALLAKPVAAYLALVLPVWRWIRVRPSDQDHTGAWTVRLKTGLLEVTPLIVVTLIVFPVAYLGQAATHSLRLETGVFQVLRDVWYALGFHLRLLLGLEVPSPKYLPETWPAPFTPSVDLVPVIVVPAVAWLTRRASPIVRPRALAGLSFAVLAYLPNSNLIPLTRTLADVYVFMPLVGLAWWAAALVDPLFERLSLTAVRAAIVVVVGAALTLLVLPVSAHWRDSVTLWSHAYARYPHDQRLCRNLGNARFELQGPAAALEQYQACVERFGGNAFYKNIGLAHAALGHTQQAIAALERASRVDPNDERVRWHLDRLRTIQQQVRPR